MLYRSLFPSHSAFFGDFDRLARDVQSFFDASPAIRGVGRAGYPALNVGTTPQAVDVYAFAPGMEGNDFEVNLDKGVLSIAGERKSDLPAAPTGTQTAGANGKTTLHMNERAHGRFRRVVDLPDDVDPASVEASYRDGVLHVRIARRAAAQPRRITVQ